MVVKVFYIDIFWPLLIENSPKNQKEEDLNSQTNMQNWDSKYKLFHETFISNFKFETIKDFSCRN